MIYTEPETADLLRVQPSTLERWRREGTGPTYVRLGGRVVRYRQADLDAWLDTQAVHASR